MLFRALMNVRAPKPIDEIFLQVQNEYLQEAIEEKGVTDLHDLTPVKDNLYVWQGDITTLRCDAIVNAANSQMTGCYISGSHLHLITAFTLTPACSCAMTAFKKCKNKVLKNEPAKQR